MNALTAALTLAAAADSKGGKISADERALIIELMSPVKASEVEKDIDETLALLARQDGVALCLEKIGLQYIEDETSETITSNITKGAQCYALVAEFIMRNQNKNKIENAEELRVLECLGEELRIAKLTRAAIDLTMQIRFTDFS